MDTAESDRACSDHCKDGILTKESADLYPVKKMDCCSTTVNDVENDNSSGPS